MKPCTLVAVVLLTLSCTSMISVPFREEIVSLPKFTGYYTISGFAVGDGGEPGEFYLLAKHVSKDGTQSQFETMLGDSNPAVRVMGLVCLSKNNYDFDTLQGDEGKILALPFGCGGMYMTLEEFSIKLKQDAVFRACFCESEERAWRAVRAANGSTNSGDCSEMNPSGICLGIFGVMVEPTRQGIYYESKATDTVRFAGADAERIRTPGS